MTEIIYSGEFFNVKDTVECGQLFRYAPYKKGYKVFSGDKCAYIYNENGNAIIVCNTEDRDYFYNYFDLNRDYKAIFDSAQQSPYGILRLASTLGKGIRILNQDKEENLFSFIISQNNNIPRIKGIIERLCKSAGEKRVFCGEEYFSFPHAEALSEKSLDFFSKAGLGYRAPYILRLAKDIKEGYDIESLNGLNTVELKKRLISIYGVGPKVCDCVSLFGFHRADSFPVDTWTYKVYKNDFKGKIEDRKKISEWFVNEFKGNSGYFQQYLFYYKRSLENNN